MGQKIYTLAIRQLLVKGRPGLFRGQESIGKGTWGNHGGSDGWMLKKKPVARNEKALGMAGEQCPQVSISGVRSVIHCGRHPPHRIGDQVRKQPVEFLAGQAMQPDQTRTTQHARILAEQFVRHGVDEAAVEHGVQNARRRAIGVRADQA